MIRQMIETKVISLEDGLSYATNQNNLLLALKGLGGTEDFIKAQPNPVNSSSGMSMPPNQANKSGNSFLDLIE